MFVAASDHSSGDINPSAVPIFVQEVPNLGEHVEPSHAVDENKLDRKSTMSATTKLLCGVRDSPNGFSPLKSVAGSLYLILEIYEVWCLPNALNLQYLHPSSK